MKKFNHDFLKTSFWHWQSRDQEEGGILMLKWDAYLQTASQRQTLFISIYLVTLSMLRYCKGLTDIIYSEVSLRLKL